MEGVDATVDATNTESFQENSALLTKETSINVKNATSLAPDPNPAGPTPTEDVASGIQPVADFVPKDAAPLSHPTPPPDQPLVTSEADVDTEMPNAEQQPPVAQTDAEPHLEQPSQEEATSAPEPSSVQPLEPSLVRPREDDDEDEEPAAKRSKIDGATEGESAQRPADLADTSMNEDSPSARVSAHPESLTAAVADAEEVAQIKAPQVEDAVAAPVNSDESVPKLEATKPEAEQKSATLEAPRVEDVAAPPTNGDVVPPTVESQQAPAPTHIKPSTESGVPEEQRSAESDGKSQTEGAATPATAPTTAQPANAPKHSTAPMTDAQKASLLEKMKNLKKTKNSGWFIKPVDYVALNIPNYPNIVKTPMDLGTMERKLKESQYATVQDFVNDFELIVNNCRTFNGDQHQVTTAAMSMEAYFRRMIESVPSPDQPLPPKAAKRASPAVKPPPRREPRAAAAPSQPAAPTTPFALQADGMPQIRRESTANNRPARAIKPPNNREIAYAKPKRKENQLELRFCEHVLDEVRGAKYGTINHVFLAPVDPVALNIPNYRQIIKQPMDLGTMSQKLKGGQYGNAKEFKKDFDLMIENCLTFNPVGNIVRDLGVQMRRVFESHWNNKEKWERAHKPESQRATSASDDDSAGEEEEEDDEPEDEKSQQIQALQKQLEDMKDLISGIANSGTAKATKTKKPKVKSSGGGGGGSAKQKVGSISAAPKTKAPASKVGPKKPAKPKQVTYDEKQEISEAVGRMNDGQVAELTTIITENCSKYKNMEEMELEIDDLPNDVQALLLKYVRRIFGKPKGVAAADSPPDDGAFEDDGEFAPARGGNAAKRKKHKPMGKREQAEAISALKGKLAQFGQPGTSGSESPTNAGFNATKADSSGDDESEESEEE